MYGLNLLVFDTHRDMCIKGETPCCCTCRTSCTAVGSLGCRSNAGLRGDPGCHWSQSCLAERRRSAGMMPNPAPESCTTQRLLPSRPARRCRTADIVGYRQPLQSEVDHIFKAGSYQDKLSAVCLCVVLCACFQELFWQRVHGRALLPQAAMRCAGPSQPSAQHQHITMPRCFTCRCVCFNTPHAGGQPQEGAGSHGGGGAARTGGGRRMSTGAPAEGGCWWPAASSAAAGSKPAHLRAAHHTDRHPLLFLWVLHLL